jgi:hypothetical protein
MDPDAVVAVPLVFVVKPGDPRSAELCATES